MRFSDFERVRKRQGRLVEVCAARDCEKCGGRVREVVTRKAPRQHILFDSNARGEVHSCKAPTAPNVF